MFMDIERKPVYRPKVVTVIAAAILGVPFVLFFLCIVVWAILLGIRVAFFGIS
jgi:hypothetical protein